MIRVTHTKTLDGSIQQSEFSSQAEWELHPYYNNPNFVNEVVDITEEKTRGVSLDVRESELAACSEVIKLIGVFNKTKAENTVYTIVTTPAMISATLALLTGAPKTAKNLILSLASGLYSESELAQVVEVLDSVI